MTGRRIFATLHEPSVTANIALYPEEQSVFCDYKHNAVYPVPNKWGIKGCTTFELRKAPQELTEEALHTAFSAVMSAKSKKRRK